jgi:uncharacterized protein (DUF2147 family)
VGVRLNSRAAVAGALACFVALTSAAPTSDGLTGVWRNPRGSVHVDIRPCGAALCGVVVWASDKAKQDARRGGTEHLVGANLLRDFVERRDGSWRGKVYVPDLAKTVSGSIELTGPGTLKARSCALGVVCRTQIWTRIG